MFFKITDDKGDVGYMNINAIEFIRKDLNGSLSLYYISKRNPLKLSPKSSKDLLQYLEVMQITEVN